VHPDGRWLKVNQSLCDLLGYSEDELLSIDFQSITHPDDVDEDVDLVQQMLRNEIKTYQMEKRYYHRKGKIIWALLSVSLVRYANGKPRYFISQIQDITEQREMERLKSEFISIVSHELRTPLTSIRGSLGLVIGAFSGDLTTKVKDLLNIANNNCERLILLINDILDIDKIASGQMRFNMQEESLANITTQAVETNQAYAEKYNTSIVLHPVDEALYITVDANRYIQVLSNLLSNAAKFSPEGSTIDVNISLRDNMARIAVTDYGSGVPAEFHTRIFEKFSQADSSSSRSKGGTGLGLHITKQFVEQMHGRIGFKSEPDKATTFWIEFPFAVRQASQPLPEIEENQRILICEDVPDIAKVLHLMLKHANYESDVAHTLEEARQMLAETHYTALTLDISLPDGSGLAFADELLQNSITHDIPVVMLSGNERSVVDEGQEDRPNVVRWLTKPVFQRDLLDAIHAAFAATSERKGKR
jgi:PAS domain S-box-containing protein